MKVPDLDTLAQWLDRGDAELDALAQQLDGSPDPSAAGRWARLQSRLDRAVSPEGLSDAVLDALHAEICASAAAEAGGSPRGARRWRRWLGAGAALAMAAGLLLVLRPSPPTEGVPGPSVPSPPSRPLVRGPDAVVPDTGGPVLQVEVDVREDGLYLGVSASPGPDGVPVDVGSLRLYSAGQDLTPRLGAPQLPLSHSGLALPPGTHRLTIVVKDASGRQSVEEVEVTVP